LKTFVPAIDVIIEIAAPWFNGTVRSAKRPPHPVGDLKVEIAVRNCST